MPLAAGLLKSYAETNPEIKENYQFAIKTEREYPEDIVEQYESPAVLAFSIYFWNLNQTLQTVKLARQKYPETLIVVGGPSVPLYEHDVQKFFEEHPYVDVVVPGEGEIVFSNILLALLQNKPLESVEGISIRKKNGEVLFQEKSKYITDVSVVPSPFLDGTFDELLNGGDHHFTGVVWETNRGCPFLCSFCFWGGPDSKISQFPIDRALNELQWISDRKISYIFGADANFGILKRDVDIAKAIAKLNRETGYPKFFVINWTKNATEKIFDVVDALRDSTIRFMLTTSVQSHNPETLKAIKRDNIRLNSFNKILEEATKRNFHTYSELILGLPLETYETFRNGISKVLTPNIRYHFNVYICVLIPGTEMAHPDYVAEYGIKTRRCKMDVGRTILNERAIMESQDVVVETSTMPLQDWCRSHTFAYMCKSIYGFRLGFFILNYLRSEYGVDPAELMEYLISKASKEPSEFPLLNKGLEVMNELQTSLLNNGLEVVKIEGVESALFPEVALLVTFLREKREFYREIDRVVQSYFTEKGLSLNHRVYAEVWAFQYAHVPTWYEPNKNDLNFRFNIQEYFKEAEELKENETHVLFESSAEYKDINDFLGKQIYGGMIFSLCETKDSSLGTQAADQLYQELTC